MVKLTLNDMLSPNDKERNYLPEQTMLILHFLDLFFFKRLENCIITISFTKMTPKSSKFRSKSTKIDQSVNWDRLKSHILIIR